MAKQRKIKKQKSQSSPIVAEQLNLEEIGQEIYDATIESFEKELAENAPAQKLVSSYSEIVSEFFLGLREGIQAELQDWKDQNTSSGAVSDTLKDIDLAENQPEQTKDVLVAIKELLEQQKQQQDNPPIVETHKMSGIQKFGIGFLGGLLPGSIGTDWAKQKVSKAESEETANEEAVKRDKELFEQQTQSALLAKIVDLLDKQSKGETPIQTGSGPNLPDVDIDLPLGGKPSAGKVPPKGKPGMWQRGKDFFKSPKALKMGAGILAVGAGAYTAYSGFKDAGEQTEASLVELEELKKTGQITEEEYITKKKEIESLDTENKGGALGSGAGMAAGAIGGMKAGALLGSFFGPAGTLVGGAAGGIIGGIAGSGVGQNIGGALGKGWSYLTEDKGGDPITDQEAALVQSAIESKQLQEKTEVLKSIESKTNEVMSSTEQKPNIIVQAPPPVVVPSSGGSQVVVPPFTKVMKHDEPSIGSYVRRRYTVA